jgi:PBP1b-binding outer membrane lipoprotein LpoB
MRKTFWFGLVMLLTLLLSACAQQTAVPQATTAPATQEMVATSTQEEVATTVVETTTEQTGPAQCQPYNLIDQIIGALDPNLAPITADDHILGPDNAAMTLIDFSDYQ